MKVFKTVEWDAAGENDNYKELFKKDKKDYKIGKKGKKNKNKLKKIVKKAFKNDEDDKQQLITQTPKAKIRPANKTNLNKISKKLKKNRGALKNEEPNKKKFPKDTALKKETSIEFQLHQDVKEKLESLRKKVTTATNKGVKLKTKRAKKALHQPSNEPTSSASPPKPVSLIKKQKEKLRAQFKQTLKDVKAASSKSVPTLRQKMMDKLKAARFRFLNEQIYTTSSAEAQQIFKSDPDAFTAYHEGYRQQVQSWPVNPVSCIIESIRKMPKSHIVADLGCGDAQLAKSVDQRVHSFDLVAVDDNVTACDMSKLPLKNASVDVAVFCLSLMGTNLKDYILEANRILKVGGTLKIAEVESRFEDLDVFVKSLLRYGFKNTWKDLSHNLFYFLDFTKVNNVQSKKKLPNLSLLPCLYKKR